MTNQGVQWLSNPTLFQGTGGGRLDNSDWRENEVFENEVRRIARELWPSAAHSGAAIVDGRERDGVFATEECIHLVEATTSRSKNKAFEDIGKLVDLGSKLQRRNSSRAVKCWFVTRDEPTPEQRRVAHKQAPLVIALSYAQFQSKLIDSHAYLAARANYAFGSVRDPGTGAFSPRVEYIPLDLVRIRSKSLMNVDELLGALVNCGRFVILGDYGAGKSMTLRHLYQELCKIHLRGSSSVFPVYVNLRDHFGQTEPSEILQRHAKAVGFGHPHHLVRAWRAGFVTLLLDGFDEVTTIGIQGLWRKLQDNRFRAMEAVRRFVREHPLSSGIVVAGRAHFFDSEAERRRALELSEDFVEVSLTEFTDDQIRSYFERSGLVGSVPQWLPSRPLLVGYLAAKGLIGEISRHDPSVSPDPAVGWDRLLNAVADREALIEAGIDGRTVRRILERLATKARSAEGGVGPLTADDVVTAFKDICGYNPDERGMVLLQRLPGLGIDRAEEGTRSFIDEDFADACRAGDLVEFIEQPYAISANTFEEIECALMTLGVSVASVRLKALALSFKQINAAVARAVEFGHQHLISDVCRIALELGCDIGIQVYVKDILIPDLELSCDNGGASRLCFQSCFFVSVGLDSDVSEDCLPRFQGCYIGELDGRISRSDLPVGAFDEDCVIDEFMATADTTDDILSLDLPLGTKVLLTILKKLFQRRGSGRRESALNRGLDHRSRRVVPEILKLLEANHVVIRYRKGETTIWLPDRRSTKRVGRIVSSPTASTDPLVIASVALE